MKAFPASKQGQVRGSRASLGDLGRGQLVSLLALFIPRPLPCFRLLAWLKLVEAAQPSSWKPPGAPFSPPNASPSPLLRLKAAAPPPPAVGPEAGAGSTSSKADPRPCFPRLGCVTLSRAAVFAALSSHQGTRGSSSVTFRAGGEDGSSVRLAKGRPHRPGRGWARPLPRRVREQ